MDLNALVKKHECQIAGERVVYLPKTGSNQLLVVFATLSQPKYLLFRTLASDRRMNLLFVTDSTDSFYCCEGRDRVYSRILQRFTKEFDPRNVTMFGASMGGNGAIFHGLKSRANVIAINPIVDWKTSLMLTTLPALRKRLKELGGDNFINLQDLLKIEQLHSAIFCQFNCDYMGIENAKLLSQSWPAYSSFIFEMVNSPWHTAVDDITTSEAIYNRIALLSNLRKIRAPSRSIFSKGGDVVIKKKCL